MSLFKKVLKAVFNRLFYLFFRIVPIENFEFYSIGAHKRAKKLGFGEGTRVYSTAIIYGCPKVGKNVFIGPYSVIDGTGSLVIEDDSQISLHAMIWTHDTHERCLLGDDIARNRKRIEDVTIENNVWVGAGAIITPGVLIGHHSMVAAGAVVTKNVPPCSLVAGVPASVIAKIKIEGDVVKYDLLSKVRN